MHPNPSFRKTPSEINIEFARRRGFGALAVNAQDGPLISHVPFVLLENGKTVELHLVRSNPILKALDHPQPAVIAVRGPHSYVSPDWYGIVDQVPTWNYVAVHLRGSLERLPQDNLLPMLERLSAQFESMLPKAQWTMDMMSEEALERMTRMIVPCRLSISDVQGTWKAGQNKDDAVRLAAADSVERFGIGEGVAAMARLMRSCVPDPMDSGFKVPK